MNGGPPRLLYRSVRNCLTGDTRVTRSLYVLKKNRWVCDDLWEVYAWMELPEPAPKTEQKQ